MTMMTMWQPGCHRFLACLVGTGLLAVAACDGPGQENQQLFRAPPIPNEVDGVVWEAGNWEPHLAAGEEGVSWGNHRAVVVVGEEAQGEEARGQAGVDAVRVTIPWRRPDADPASRSIIVVDSATGQAVANVLALRAENASGEVVFQPNPGSSTYYVYYMPWQSTGGNYPTVTYPTPEELRVATGGSGALAAGQAESPSRAQDAGPSQFTWAGLAPNPDPVWEERVRGAPEGSFPAATTTRIQSVNAFHSFFPMEVVATEEETAAFFALALADESATADSGGSDSGASDSGAQASGAQASRAQASGAGWAVIPEHRDRPVRMRSFIPAHWAKPDSAPSGLQPFHSQVLRDEAFTFQLVVAAGAEPLQDVQVTFQGFPEFWTKSLTCFNCEGIDENGVRFQKTVDVSAGTLQPLWIGVMVPEDQPSGFVEGTVTVASAHRGSRTIPISLEVRNGQAENHGFNEPELQTRLVWLNSTLGTNPDLIIEPFEPVGVAGADDNHVLSVLGRRIELAESGLPTQIYSYFTPELTGFSQDPDPILARPITLEIRAGNPSGSAAGTAAGSGQAESIETLESEPFQVRQVARGRVEWSARSRSDRVTLSVDGALEYDGMLDYHMAVVALTDLDVADIVLPVSLQPEAGEYMLGLGRKGGKRPPSVDWTWAVENHQEGVWLGGVNKGLQYVLRDENYVRPLNTNFYRNQPLNMPPSWYNQGRGGIRIVEEHGEAVTAYNYSGPRSMNAGDTLHFNVRFLVTPFKPIDTRAHFNTRFVHQYVPVDSVKAWGGTVVNIHHANEINPYINYPFFNLDQQAAYIDEAHQKGIKVKLYYTIRELTYKANELFALRSLGDEILNDGEGGGHSWMQEHLRDHYHSAWHAWRVDDAAMLDKGTSRWTNYYIEGLNWLAAKQQIDGLYLDDIAFSRETVKRLVNVLHQHRPEVVIDLHSANQFNVRDGFTNSAMLYMEHFPFISRLWFGEYFEYDLDEDYWMTEVAGLPFGLMGEMLQDGGQPYRGLLYGMTTRKYGNTDPRPVWAMMNDFGIAESEMKGYWLEDAAVRTDHPRILATTYVRPDGLLVALASWSGTDEVVSLTVNLEDVLPPGSPLRAQGIQAQGLQARAPHVAGLQEEAELDLSAVRVPAGRGLFVLIGPSGRS